MGKEDRKKKIINARSRDLVGSLSIFNEAKVAELDTLKVDIFNILDNEILPLKKETTDIRETVKAFRKSDVERIESIMDLMKESMTKLVVDKGYNLKHILEFPYIIEVTPEEESLESDISDSEFVRPEHLRGGMYWRNRIGRDAKEDPMGETLEGIKEDTDDDDDDDEDDSEKTKGKCKSLDAFVPPKLVVACAGQTSCKHLNTRLIYFDEPFDHATKSKKRTSKLRSKSEKKDKICKLRVCGEKSH